jgi:hypothetical protein
MSSMGKCCNASSACCGSSVEAQLLLSWGGWHHALMLSALGYSIVAPLVVWSPLVFSCPSFVLAPTTEAPPPLTCGSALSPLPSFAGGFGKYGVLREAVPPRNQPFASRSPRVFRILEDVRQLILLSFGHKGTTSRSIYSMEESSCYCFDCCTINRKPGLLVQWSPCAKNQFMERSGQLSENRRIPLARRPCSIFCHLRMPVL